MISPFSNEVRYSGLSGTWRSHPTLFTNKRVRCRFAQTWKIFSHRLTTQNSSIINQPKEDRCVNLVQFGADVHAVLRFYRCRYEY